MPGSYSVSQQCERHHPFVLDSGRPATVAELADAPALGAGGATRGGSSPSGRILGTWGWGFGTREKPLGPSPQPLDPRVRFSPTCHTFWLRKPARSPAKHPSR